MAASLDRVFEQVHRKIPMRPITLREATGWNDTTNAPTYAADRDIKAIVVDRPRKWDTERNAYVVVDGCFLTIWFKDWFSRSTYTATTAELQSLAQSAKGNVLEVDATFYSRFIVDGTEMQYQSHRFLPWPDVDATLYAVQFTLQAA
jgi:hypothetical protein